MPPLYALRRIRPAHFTTFCQFVVDRVWCAWFDGGVPKKPASKRDPWPVAADAPKFEVGAKCVIRKPHLWSGAACEVESHIDGKHRVKIKGKSSREFHSDVPGQMLERDFAAMLES